MAKYKLMHSIVTGLIAPEIKHDTLVITYYQPKESFAFKTDIDSIEFELLVNTSKDFYVKLNDSIYVLFNLISTLNDILLNSAKFQKAISNQYNELRLQSLSNEIVSKQNYVEFVYDYLFYFDSSLDNRYGKMKTIKSTTNILLCLYR